MKVAGSRGFGAAANNVSVTGGVLDLNGTNYNTANPLSLNGTGISGGGALVNSSASPGTFAGVVTLASDASIGGTNGDITLTNNIQGNFNLTKTGTNTLTLNKNTDSRTFRECEHDLHHRLRHRQTGTNTKGTRRR